MLGLALIIVVCVIAVWTVVVVALTVYTCHRYKVKKRGRAQAYKTENNPASSAAANKQSPIAGLPLTEAQIKEHERAEVQIAIAKSK